MRHPAFQNFPRQILYLGLCILTGLALTLCQFGLVPVPTSVLLLDGLMLGILAGMLAYLLWFVVFFAQLSGGQPMQRIVNHSALMVLLLADESTDTPVALSSPQKFLETISVKTGQKIHLVQVSAILFIQAEGDYVLIHTPEGKFLKEQTMKYFEENLPAEHFVRIHRSCIVHAECISKIELYEKQNYRITLKSGQQLKASATGYKLLKAALKL